MGGGEGVFRFAAELTYETPIGHCPGPSIWGHLNGQSRCPSWKPVLLNNQSPIMAVQVFQWPVVQIYR